MAERWVINASPVILLAKAGVIDLLPKACDELVIPFSVVAEVSTGKTEGLFRQRVLRLKESARQEDM